MQIYFKLGGAFLTAFVIVLTTTPWVLKLALHLNIVDKPNSRRVNKVPIPIMGGLAIAAGFWIATLLFANYRPELLVLAIGTGIITALGLLDDVKNLSPWFKLAVQCLAAFIVVRYGYKIEWIRSPFGAGYLFLRNWATPLTMIWIIGVTNAFNFIDGLDGLAAGTAGIASITLLIVALGQQHIDTVVLMAALAGSCIAFLKYNFNPAKIFMGDTGSLSLGFLLAVISIDGLMKSATTIALIVPVLVLGLPIADITVSIVRRLAKGKSPFLADRGHLHHRLLDQGHPQRKAVVILYTLNILFGVLAVAVTKIPQENLLLVVSLGSLSVVAIVYLFIKHIFAVASQPQDTQM